MCSSVSGWFHSVYFPVYPCPRLIMGFILIYIVCTLIAMWHSVVWIPPNWCIILLLVGIWVVSGFGSPKYCCWELFCACVCCIQVCTAVRWWIRCSGLALLGRRVRICSLLMDAASSFSSVAVPFCTPSYSVGEFRLVPMVPMNTCQCPSFSPAIY